MTYEVNFDGIVGPTHNYSGLSYGNIASQENQYTVSNPKEAALQGLEKMKFLWSLGLKQGVLPPHERPHIPTLRALGFRGTDSGILKDAFKYSPEVFTGTSSAAYMWAANAATICPSADNVDRRLHFTPANLTSNFHRSIESETTGRALKIIFKDPLYFKHHDPLPSGYTFSDEGAANHSRFCMDYGAPGVQLFVFGRYSYQRNPVAPAVYPARQSYEASEAIVRLHQLYPDRVVFAQQHPAAIDAGAFHNDVVSVGNGNVFLYHEKAFVGKEAVIEETKKKFEAGCEGELVCVEVKESQVSLKEAVSTYLFNSQIVTLSHGEMCLISPSECQMNEQVRYFLNEMIQAKENPISQVHFINLQQSMWNGGGPACLRLRVVMNENELAAMHPHVLFDDRLYTKLYEWINRNYRDRLEIKDLGDPQLLLESQKALDELTKILQLGSFYHFQSTSVRT